MLDDLGRHAHEVAERQLGEVDLLDAQPAEHVRPVDRLEAVAADQLEVGRHVAQLAQHLAQVLGHGAGGAGLGLLHPRGHEVVELPQPAAEGDPVLDRELGQLVGELLDEPERAGEGLEVGAHLVAFLEVRRRLLEVLALVRHLRAHALDRVELGLEVGEPRTHVAHRLRVADRDRLGLELEPARGEVGDGLLALGHALGDAGLAIGHQRSHHPVERLHRHVELVPLGAQRAEVGRGAARAARVREQLRLLAQLAQRVLRAAHALLEQRARLPRLEDLLVARRGRQVQRAARLAHEGLHLRALRLESRLHRAGERAAHPRVLVVERRLEGHERDGDAVDLEDVGQLVRLLAPRLERRVVCLPLTDVGAVALHELVDVVEPAEPHPRLE
mmetsp:Transcript_19752/g.46579  ORF Transcript_19752/g.46579 Transcript_19752/m.46579 type:complete len:388 (+) Transcript_19752:1477-2640(+)